MEFQRQSARLDPRRYCGQNTYFVTFCCDGRRRIFSAPENAEWLIARLNQQSNAYGFLINAYCVMPDHVHILVAGRHHSSDLLKFLRNLKQTTAHKFRKNSRGTLWQRGFHEHILRPNDNALSVALYIFMNPVRAGLSADPRQYPFSGSSVMDWKKGFANVSPWTPPWKPGHSSEHDRAAS